MENVMNHIPESIMQRHDPNDDPFAALADDSTNQLTNPMEYGSGLNYFIEKKQDKEEHAEMNATEESTSSTEEDAAAADDSAPEEKGEPNADDDKDTQEE